MDFKNAILGGPGQIGSPSISRPTILGYSSCQSHMGRHFTELTEYYPATRWVRSQMSRGEDTEPNERTSCP